MNLKVETTLLNLFSFSTIYFGFQESLFSFIDFNFEGTFVEGPQCKYKPS